MARRIYKVELIVLAVPAVVSEPGGLELDGYSPLPFQIHVVQELFLHVPLLHIPGLFD